MAFPTTPTLGQLHQEDVEWYVYGGDKWRRLIGLSVVEDAAERLSLTQNKGLTRGTVVTEYTTGISWQYNGVAAGWAQIDFSPEAHHVDTAAAIALASGATSLYLKGYYNAGDLGGGHFVLNATSTATVDSGSVFATASGVGRWIRIPTDHPRPEWFGAKGDGAIALNSAVTGTDDGPAIEACLDAYGECYLSNKVYAVAGGPAGSSITPTAAKSLRVFGESPVDSVIAQLDGAYAAASKTPQHIFYAPRAQCPNLSEVELRNIGFYCNQANVTKPDGNPKGCGLIVTDVDQITISDNIIYGYGRAPGQAETFVVQISGTNKGTVTIERNEFKQGAADTNTALPEVTHVLVQDRSGVRIADNIWRNLRRDPAISSVSYRYISVHGCTEAAIVENTWKNCDGTCVYINNRNSSNITVRDNTVDDCAGVFVQFTNSWAVGSFKNIVIAGNLVKMKLDPASVATSKIGVLLEAQEKNTDVFEDIFIQDNKFIIDPDREGAYAAGILLRSPQTWLPTGYAFKGVYIRDNIFDCPAAPTAWTFDPQHIANILPHPMAIVGTPNEIFSGVRADLAVTMEGNIGVDGTPITAWAWNNQYDATAATPNKSYEPYQQNTAANTRVGYSVAELNDGFKGIQHDKVYLQVNPLTTATVDGQANCFYLFGRGSADTVLPGPYGKNSRFCFSMTNQNDWTVILPRVDAAGSDTGGIDSANLNTNLEMGWTVPGQKVKVVGWIDNGTSLAVIANYTVKSNRPLIIRCRPNNSQLAGKPFWFVEANADYTPLTGTPLNKSALLYYDIFSQQAAASDLTQGPGSHNITSDASIIPTGNAVYNLGKAKLPWKTIYANEIVFEDPALQNVDILSTDDKGKIIAGSGTATNKLIRGQGTVPKIPVWTKVDEQGDSPLQVDDVDHVGSIATIAPTKDHAYDLGTTTEKWRSIYAHTLQLSKVSSAAYLATDGSGNVIRAVGSPTTDQIGHMLVLWKTDNVDTGLSWPLSEPITGTTGHKPITGPQVFPFFSSAQTLASPPTFPASNGIGYSYPSGNLVLDIRKSGAYSIAINFAADNLGDGGSQSNDAIDIIVRVTKPDGTFETHLLPIVANNGAAVGTIINYTAYWVSTFTAKDKVDFFYQVTKLGTTTAASDAHLYTAIFAIHELGITYQIGTTGTTTGGTPALNPEDFVGFVENTGHGTPDAIDLTNLPIEASLDATSKGTYYIWVGAAGYVIGTADIGGATSSINGTKLNYGDWIHVTETAPGVFNYDVASGDVVAKPRGDNLYGLNTWAAGTYEQGTLIIFNGEIYKAATAITATTGDPATATTAWTKIPLSLGGIRIPSVTAHVVGDVLAIKNPATDEVEWVKNTGGILVVADEAARAALDTTIITAGTLVSTTVENELWQWTGDNTTYFGGWRKLVAEPTGTTNIQKLVYDPELAIGTRFSWIDDRAATVTVADRTALLAIPVSHLNLGKLVYVISEKLLYELTTDPTAITNTIADWTALGLSIPEYNRRADLPQPSATTRVQEGELALVRKHANAITPYDRLFVARYLNPTDLTTATWLPTSKAIFVKALQADLDIPDGLDGDVQFTLETGHFEIKEYSGAATAWQLLYSEDNIKSWIAAGNLFLGTAEEPGHGTPGAIDIASIAAESALGATEKGKYYTWVGTAGYTIAASAIGGGVSSIDGATLNVGDWIQCAESPPGTFKYVVIPGDLLAKSRGDNLYGLNTWAVGAYEPGSLIVYQGKIYKASRAVTTADGNPEAVGNPWAVITLAAGVKTVATDADRPALTGVSTDLYLVVNSALAGNSPALYMWDQPSLQWRSVSGAAGGGGGGTGVGGSMDLSQGKILTNLGTPIGSILWWCSTTVPHGYHECDGTAYDRVQYPELFTVLGTAVLPNFRGKFFRAADSNWDNMAVHQWTTGMSRNPLTASQQGAHTHTYNDPLTGGGGLKSSDHWANETVRYPTGNLTGHAGAHSHTVSGGDTETAPDHIRLMCCIKMTDVQTISMRT